MANQGKLGLNLKDFSGGFSSFFSNALMPDNKTVERLNLTNDGIGVLIEPYGIARYGISRVEGDFTTTVASTTGYPSSGYRWCALSETGKCIAVPNADGYIYNSLDFGETWMRSYLDAAGTDCRASMSGTLSNTLGDTARMLEYAPSGAEAEQGKETKRRLKYTENDLRAMLTSYLKKVEGDVYLQNKQAETQMVMANAQNKAVANMGLQDMLYRLIPNLISGGGSGAGNFPGRNVSPASYLGTLGLRR